MYCLDIPGLENKSSVKADFFFTVISRDWWADTTYLRITGKWALIHGTPEMHFPESQNTEIMWLQAFKALQKLP